VNEPVPITGGRELTPDEKYCWYRWGRWPCCQGTGYLAGPRGGVMQNIKCPRCGTEMNVFNPEDRRYWGVLGFGQMLHEPENYRPAALPLHVRAIRALSRGTR
jgi:hypothetical protein